MKISLTSKNSQMKVTPVIDPKFSTTIDMAGESLNEAFTMDSALTMNSAESVMLNLQAVQIIRKYGISIPLQENAYDELRRNSYIGFAEFYLRECSEKSYKINVSTFKRLLEIDSQLGTTQEEQLFECFCYPIQISVIKVWQNMIFFSYHRNNSGNMYDESTF